MHDIHPHRYVEINLLINGRSDYKAEELLDRLQESDELRYFPPHSTLSCLLFVCLKE